MQLDVGVSPPADIIKFTTIWYQIYIYVGTFAMAGNPDSFSQTLTDALAYNTYSCTGWVKGQHIYTWYVQCILKRSHQECIKLGFWYIWSRVHMKCSFDMDEFIIYHVFQLVWYILLSLPIPIRLEQIWFSYPLQQKWSQMKMMTGIKGWHNFGVIKVNFLPC